MGNEIPGFPQVPGYEIKRVLGSGGMATVYLAIQESLSRPVALKIMDQALVVDADFRSRFLREGRLIAQLYHPNIVSVYDIGAANNVHYLSMPYFSGGTLDQRLDQRVNQGLPPALAVKIVKSLASALGCAHELGIIHRDIKPGNVLFTDTDEPILTDFGIAKTIGNETMLTAAGITVGSIQYMSPEQAQGRIVDNRSDLYSLGVVFWQMLTGSLPYQAKDFFTLAIQHAKDPIPRLADPLRPFQPIIDSLLAKRPEDRCASGAELLARFEAIPCGDIESTQPINHGETRILPTLPAVAAVGERSAPDESRTRQTPTARPSRGSVKMLAYAAMIGVVAGVGYYGYLSETPGPSSVQRLLREADQHWQAGRLTEPSGANAFETYSRALELDPENVEAKQRLVGIGRINAANKMFLAAERLLRSGEIDDARRMIETGLKINPNDDRLLGLRRALE